MQRNMKKVNKKISSIFENCHETASQEAFLRRCGFALQGDPPDSVPTVGISPPLNDGVESHRDSDDSDSLIASGYDAVETEAVRFVSPPQSTDTEDTATDLTVRVESEVEVDLEEDTATDRTVLVESEVDLVSSRKKLKVPLRDVVKAIVMNSRNTEEEEEEGKEIEKMSYVQILARKGFNFP